MTAGQVGPAPSVDGERFLLLNNKMVRYGSGR